MAKSNTDIIEILVRLGVDENQANQVISNMNGIDYLNMVNALDKSDEGKTVSEILQKYGIKLGVTEMTDARLTTIFDKMKKGSKYDEADTSSLEHVRSIAEMDHHDSLAASGYSLAVKIENHSDADKLRDWLEQNEVEYHNDDAFTFLILSGEDKDLSYRLNQFVSTLNGKSLIMDQNKVESKMVEKKINMKFDSTRPANPVSKALASKSGGGAHTSKNQDTKDPFSRKGKHKKRITSESRFEPGELVEYMGNECPVHIPNGPNGTIGILLDGKVKIVNDCDVNRIDEGVLGMTRVDPIFRLRELAGLGNQDKAILEDEFDVQEIDIEDDIETDEFELEMDDEIDLGDTIEVDTDTFVDDFGDEIIDTTVDTDVVYEMPGNSPAFTEILNQLNTIQMTLGEVKLSEYKSLVAKLEALTGQIRSMGRNYLGERRRK